MMNKSLSKPKTYVLIGALIVVAVLLIVVFTKSGADSDRGDETKISTTPGSTGTNLTKVDVGAAEVVQKTSAHLAGLSLLEIIEQSQCIVSGVAVDKSDAILIEPTNGAEPQFFTDIYFNVDTVYAGDPIYCNADIDGESALAIRVEGGASGRLATVNDMTPEFEKGQRYLLFLNQASGGACYNTEGSHYYVVGVKTGAWSESEANTFTRSSTHPHGENDITDESLLTLLAQNPVLNTVDKSRGMNGTLEEIQEEYELGKISKESYERSIDLAKQETSAFAKVLSEAEQQEYEERVLTSGLRASSS